MPIASLRLGLALLPLAVPAALSLEPKDPGSNARLVIVYQYPVDARNAQPVADERVPALFEKLVYARNQMRAKLPSYRSQGWRGQSLVYLNFSGIAARSNLHSQPGVPCTTADWQFQGYQNRPAMDRGDFCEIISAIHTGQALADYPDIYPDESWFLHGTDGRRIVSLSGANSAAGYEYRTNPAAPGWREYVARRALRELSGAPNHQAAVGDYPPVQTGIFLDNIERTLHKFNRGLFVPNGWPVEYRDAAGQPRHADYAAAIAGLAARTRAVLTARDPSYHLWGNLGDEQNWAPYQAGQSLNGAMIESFALRWGGEGPWSVPVLLQQLETVAHWQAAKVGSLPRQAMLAAPTRFGDPAQLAREARFAYGMYLLVAQGTDTVFNLHDSEGGGQRYERFLNCPDYALELGAPTGPYSIDPVLANGLPHDTVLRRGFSAGEVVVNLSQGTASLPGMQEACRLD